MCVCVCCVVLCCVVCVCVCVCVCVLCVCVCIPARAHLWLRAAHRQRVRLRQKRLHRRDPRGDVCRVAQPCGHAHRRRRLAARRVCACVRAYACERVRVSVLRVCCVCVLV